jgi:hypothetical protein
MEKKAINNVSWFFSQEKRADTNYHSSDDKGNLFRSPNALKVGLLQAGQRDRNRTNPKSRQGRVTNEARSFTGQTLVRRMQGTPSGQ